MKETVPPAGAHFVRDQQHIGGYTILILLHVVGEKKNPGRLISSETSPRVRGRLLLIFLRGDGNMVFKTNYDLHRWCPSAARPEHRANQPCRYLRTPRMSARRLAKTSHVAIEQGAASQRAHKQGRFRTSLHAVKEDDKKRRLSGKDEEQ